MQAKLNDTLEIFAILYLTILWIIAAVSYHIIQRVSTLNIYLNHRFHRFSSRAIIFPVRCLLSKFRFIVLSVRSSVSTENCIML